MLKRITSKGHTPDFIETEDLGENLVSIAVGENVTGSKNIIDLNKNSLDELIFNLQELRKEIL